MVAELLDSTSSPSNRRSSIDRNSGWPYVDEVEESWSGNLVTVSSDKGVSVVIRDVGVTGSTPPWAYQWTWEHAQRNLDFYAGSHVRAWYRITVGGDDLYELTESHQAGVDRAIEALAHSIRLLGEISANIAPNLHGVGTAIQGSLESVKDALVALGSNIERHPEHVQHLRQLTADLAALRERTDAIRVEEERERHEELQVTVAPPPWLEDLNRLKALASLTDDELASLFDVSRGNVQGWLHRGQGMRRHRQRHLLNTLAVIEDSSQRLNGDPQALHHLLLTPASPSGRTPFDYLVQRQYRTARGYLQIAGKTRGDRRTPLRPDVRRPEADRLGALEELSPSPRETDGPD
jgi:hypothetical protein